MAGDLGCGFRTDERRKFGDGRLGDSFDRSEMTKKLHLSLRANSRNLRKLGGEVAFFSSLSMKLKGRLMRLLADLKYKSKSERVPVKRDRRILATVDQKMRYVAVPLWRFDESDEHYRFQVE